MNNTKQSALKNKWITAALLGMALATPLFAQLQNPSSGVYSITESSASDSQLHLKNTQSSGISRLISIGGNGSVTTQMISDPTTSLSRFGSASTGIDVDLFTARDLFLSTTSGSTLTPRLTVKQSGAVGINTLTPQKVFEIQTISNDTIAFGKQLAVGEWTGIQFGYLEPWNTYYRKAAIVFERTDSTSARGKIHLLNNISDQPNSAGISDARLTIDETGKVGIGTATPKGQLDVLGTTVIRNYSGSDGLRILRGADTNSPAFQVTIDSTAPYINSWGPLVIQTAETGGTPGERLRIGTNGNIGVHNGSPSKTLDVAGTFGVSGQTTLGPVNIVGMTWVQSGDFRVGDSVASPSIRLSGPNNWDFYLGISTDKVYLRRNSDPKFTFTSDGKLGIGTTTPVTPLHVNGVIKATDLIISAGSWADYVFESNYKLLSLNTVESFIKTNKHLPDVPSEAEVKANGVKVSEMQVALLRKVEELTLYILDLNKRQEKLEASQLQLEKENATLKQKIEALSKK